MKKKLNCILLVDDDEATNFLNTMFLEEADVTKNIKTVLNGKEALEYLTSTGSCSDSDIESTSFPQPELILLDINMPVMDGWEFIQAYRQLPKEQRAKIIIAMLTTSLNPEDKSKADKIIEINAFEHKPLSEVLISQIMKRYFPDYV